MNGWYLANAPSLDQVPGCRGRPLPASRCLVWAPLPVHRRPVAGRGGPTGPWMPPPFAPPTKPQCVSVVAQLVEAASERGAPGEPTRRVQFESLESLGAAGCQPPPG